MLQFRGKRGTVFATDCVDRFFQTIPFWIDIVKMFKFTIYKFFTPMFFSDFPTKRKETPQRRSETQKN